ncbi:hypothetical protein JW916_01010 [Candidatus Sumerlaeota bacterium]|nr:hypothetical protein [Candidatus Sumerlaeota bacterium]
MGKTSISGIGGVLGGLISEPSQTTKPTESEPTAPTRPPKRLVKRSKARTGRPPGKGDSGSTQKEKLTVRIDADLVEQYRDWSWDARCNLGELVGQAMRLHLRNRHHDC